MKDTVVKDQNPFSVLSFMSFPYCHHLPTFLIDMSAVAVQIRIKTLKMEIVSELLPVKIFK